MSHTQSGLPDELKSTMLSDVKKWMDSLPIDSEKSTVSLSAALGVVQFLSQTSGVLLESIVAQTGQSSESTNDSGDTKSPPENG